MPKYVDQYFVLGLVDGLNNDKRIGSNYSTKYVQKTDEAIKAFKGGNAIFTFPPMPIKCPGAPQKIMWIANDIWKNDSSVGKYTLEYNTALGVIFGVPKYANELMKLVESENVNFKKQSLLCGVDHVNSKSKLLLLISRKGWSICTIQSFRYGVI